MSDEFSADDQVCLIFQILRLIADGLWDGQV